MSDGSLLESTRERLREAARAIPVGMVGFWHCTIKPQSVRVKPSFIRNVALRVVDLETAMRGFPPPAKLPG